MRRFDESDARIRPNPRGSRPRSKLRPGHVGALDGWVVGVDRGRYQVRGLADDGVGTDGLGSDGVVVTAVAARELGHRGLVIGDRVRVVGDTAGGEGSLARIVGRGDRTGVLRRSADDADQTERVIVANVDRLAIVVAAAEPDPNPRLIDRCLVAAFDAGLEALLVVTKGDVGDGADLRAAYEPLGVTIVETRLRRDGTYEGLDALLAALAGGITVLVGASGVGKSTLVNALIPSAERATGGVNEVTGRGRHTSASAIALEIPGVGWIVDTPGVRSFGLGHVKPEHVIAAFGDIADAATDCSRGCPHAAGAACSLDAWATTPDRVARLASFRRLLSSRASTGPL